MIPAVRVIRTGRVKSEGVKSHAAEVTGIDTLLLATDEAKSEEESDIVKKVHDAARHQQTYTGLRIERVSTMGEAMDLLLVTNCHQRAWQEHVETEWQGLWEEGTATLEAMGG